MKRVIERTLRLINSNGSILVKIRPGMFSDFDFVFVKEHRYFKTTYVCAYEPDHYGGRVFEDFKSYHNHERLLDEVAFQKQVRASRIKPATGSTDAPEDTDMTLMRTTTISSSQI